MAHLPPSPCSCMSVRFGALDEPLITFVLIKLLIVPERSKVKCGKVKGQGRFSLYPKGQGRSWKPVQCVAALHVITTSLAIVSAISVHGQSDTCDNHEQVTFKV